MNDLPIISILTALPLLSGLGIIFLGNHSRALARNVAMGVSLLVLALTVLIVVRFDASSGNFQLREQLDWIPTLGVQYHVALDGLGLLMILLTAVVTPMALLASWRISDKAPVYYALVLFLQAGLLGTFTALNFFHWFLFWELSLIPAFFLVKLWGGAGRSAAATQFFVYTMVGSIAMLLAFLAIFLATGKFDFIQLAEMARDGTLNSAVVAKLGWYELTGRQLALIIFGGAFLGFAVKVPLVPFHTWLPATYSEAPVGTTMLLTGVMSKMGVYGFIRILLPLFQQEMRWVLTPLLWLAVLTIIFSASAAFAQRDIRRMFAYSSINHLGYCLLAIFAVARANTDTIGMDDKAAAMSGAFLQMFNHGLTAATLFWFVGMIEYRTGGNRNFNDFGGIRKVAPIFCGLMGISVFSSLGLPGLNGFVGEFLIFRGVFPLAPWAAALSVIGLLVTAIFLLTFLQRFFNGPLNERWASFPDLSFGERLAVAPAIALMFFLGVYPQAILGLVNQTVVRMLEGLRF